MHVAILLNLSAACFNQNINVCAGYSQHKWASKLSADTDGPSAGQKRHVQEDVGNSGGHAFTVLRLGVDQGCMISGTTLTHRFTSTVGRFTNRSRRWKRRICGCFIIGSPLLVCERCSPGCATPLNLVRPTSRDTLHTGNNTKNHCTKDR